MAANDLAEIERVRKSLEAAKDVVGAKAIRPALAVLRKRQSDVWKREWSRLSAAGERVAADLWQAAVMNLAAEKVRKAGKEGRRLSRREAQMAAATAVTDAMRRCVEGGAKSQMEFLWDLRSASDSVGDPGEPDSGRAEATEPGSAGDDGGPA